MSARPILTCDVCSARDFETVLRLGYSPPTCAMRRIEDAPRPEHRYPLELQRCGICGFVALGVSVDPGEVFPAVYPYSSHNSAALREHFKALAGGLNPRPDDLVVDIGANDGTLLRNFKCRTVGVEPTDQAYSIPAPFYREPFTEELAHLLRAEYGPARYVTACNVLAHVEDIGGVLRGIFALLDEDEGMLVAECHDLRSVVDGQWDAVYHEHLRYFDPYTLGTLLTRYGFNVQGHAQIPTHGGSFRMHASRATWPRTRQLEACEYDYAGLQAKAEATRAYLRNVTRYAPLIGIGATARATTVINYAGLDVEQIEAIAERPGSDKIGRLIPGTRIPVVDERDVLSGSDQGTVLFSWHLADSIREQLHRLHYAGRIHIAQGVA